MDAHRGFTPTQRRKDEKNLRRKVSAEAAHKLLSLWKNKRQVKSQQNAFKFQVSMVMWASAMHVCIYAWRRRKYTSHTHACMHAHLSPFFSIPTRHCFCQNCPKVSQTCGLCKHSHGHTYQCCSVLGIASRRESMLICRCPEKIQWVWVRAVHEKRFKNWFEHHAPDNLPKSSAAPCPELGSCRFDSHHPVPHESGAWSRVALALN